MSGVLRLSNNVTGRSTIIASASNDQTFTLPATGGTLLAGGSSLEVIFPSGTEALPGLHVESDVNTGLYSPTANTLGISTDGTERLRIDSSGNVGVGHSNPSAFGKFVVSGTGNLLNLNASSGASSIKFYENGAGRFNLDTLNGSAGLAFKNGAAEFMRIDSSGRVGIGVTTVNADIHIGSAAPTIRLQDTTTNCLAQIASDDNGNVYIQADHGNTQASSSIRLVVDTAERMRIDSSGNVGIGTSSSPYVLTADELNLSVGTATGHATIQLYSGANKWGAISFNDNATDGSNAGFIGYYHPNDYMVFNTSSAERLRIDSSGNVGIGAASTGANLHISSPGTTAYMTIQDSDGYGEIAESAGNLYITADRGNVGSKDLIFRVGGATERMRITSDGRLNIAGSSNLQSSLVSVNGGNYGVVNCFAGRVANTAYFNYVGIAPNNAINFVVYGTGNVANANNSYGVYSDVKLKENIVDAGSQWEDFKSVRFRKFNFKEETGFETHTQLGVIAQELELTSPNLIDERKDVDNEGNDLGTTTKSVKTSILTMKAIVALQEAMARIETLEQRLTDAGIA